jgi:deazaflavin-dependent oxidoreductase (nitroreductase family)
MSTDYANFTQRLMDELRANNGQLSGGPMAGRTLMIMTTTGAKTGQERSAIITYTKEGDDYVIAASKSGAPTNPAWFHNLVANPVATVEAGGRTFQARARVTGGEERDRLWTKHVELHPEFGEYPKITDRVIPMIVLEPID